MMSDEIHLSHKEISERKDKQTQQDNPVEGFLGDDFLAHEKRRRKWFFVAILIVGIIIAILYGVFIHWIFAHIHIEIKNYTHIIIPLILAIIPTMLTIFVLKLLSKSERENEDKLSENLGNMPIIEFIKQVVEAIKGK